MTLSIALDLRDECAEEVSAVLLNLMLKCSGSMSQVSKNNITPHLILINRITRL